MIMSLWPTSFTEDNNNTKRRASPEQNKENTHARSSNKNKIKRRGGYFVAPFCGIACSFLSAKLRLKEYLKSACDVQFCYVAALGRGRTVTGAFEVVCDERAGLYTS